MTATTGRPAKTAAKTVKDAVSDDKPKRAKIEQPNDQLEPLLDLTDIGLTRRLIKMKTTRAPEGETFELRLLDDFGIVDQQRLLNLSRRFEGLWNQEEPLSASEAESMKHALDTMFDEMVDAPKAVKKEIPDTIKGRVVTAFSLAPLLRQAQQAVEQEEQTEDLPTSES